MQYFLLLKGKISLQACCHIIQIVKICWYSSLLLNKYTQCSSESLVSCSKSSKQWPLPRFRIRPFFHYLELPVVTCCAVNWTFSSNKLSFNYQITAPNHSTKSQHQIHEAVLLSISYRLKEVVNSISTKPILYLGCVKLKHGFMCRKKHFL